MLRDWCVIESWGGLTSTETMIGGTNQGVAPVIGGPFDWKPIYGGPIGF
jgi:hypothetical protein